MEVEKDKAYLYWVLNLYPDKKKKVHKAFRNKEPKKEK